MLRYAEFYGVACMTDVSVTYGKRIAEKQLTSMGRCIMLITLTTLNQAEEHV